MDSSINCKYIGGEPIVTGLSLSQVRLFSPQEPMPFVSDSFQDNSRKIFCSDPDPIDRDILIGCFQGTDSPAFRSRNSQSIRYNSLDIFLDVPQAKCSAIRLRNVTIYKILTHYCSGWSTLTTTLSLTTSPEIFGFVATDVTSIDNAPLKGLSADQVLALAIAFSGMDTRAYSSSKSTYDVIGMLQKPIHKLNQFDGDSPECNSIRSAEGVMTVIWGLNKERQACEPHTIFESIPDPVFAGILTLDKKWKIRTSSQVKEGLGKHVGPSGMVSHVCDNHVLIVASPEDCQRDNLIKYGTYPAPLRALEYAIYQNALVLEADSMVSNLEKETAGKIDTSSLKKFSVEDLREHLLNITVVHSKVLSQCEAHFKPWIYKYELEREIIESILSQASAVNSIKAIRNRLQAINTLADELHGMAAGIQLKDQQDRLVSILNTNLVSQLQLRNLTNQLAQVSTDSNRAQKKLAWINAIVAFSAALSLLQFIGALGDKEKFTSKLISFFRDSVPITVAFFIGAAILFITSILVTTLIVKLRPHMPEWLSNLFSHSDETDPSNSSDFSRSDLPLILKQSKIVHHIVDDFENYLKFRKKDNDENSAEDLRNSMHKAFVEFEQELEEQLSPMIKSLANQPKK